MHAPGEDATVSSADMANITPNEGDMAKNSQPGDGAETNDETAAATENEEARNIPVSKFSTNNSTSPITSTDEPQQPEVNEAPKTLKAKPSAQDLLAATRAASDPFVEPPDTELAESPL